MTLAKLMSIVDDAYPDNFTANYHNKAGRPVRGSGDTLAQFVVVELAETFEPAATDEKQRETAVRHLEDAIRDLREVIRGLDNTNTSFYR